MKTYESKEEIELYILDYLRSGFSQDAEPELTLGDIGLVSFEILELEMDIEDEFNIIIEEGLSREMSISSIVNIIFARLFPPNES